MMTQRKRPDLYGLLGFAAAAMVLMSLAVAPGKANADVGVYITPCVKQKSFCANVDTIRPGTAYGLFVRFSIEKTLGSGDHLYLKGPDGTHFNGIRQWGLTVGSHKWEQSGQDVEVSEDGRTFSAKVGSLWPSLDTGDSATAELGEMGPVFTVDPIESFRVAMWTNIEDNPVFSNAIKVATAPAATFEDLRTIIKYGPSGRTKAKRVSFRFRSAGSKNFACRIDARPWHSCKSPESYRLAKGRHTFRVRAVGNDGKFGKVVKRTFRRV